MKLETAIIPLDEIALAKRYALPRPRPPPSPPVDPLRALLAAFQALERQGVGPNAFGATLSECPLTFLLDTMRDAVLIRKRDGALVYQNRAARDLGRAGGSSARFEHRGVTYERRRMTYDPEHRHVVVEIVTRVR